jgi:hypothetical protein
MTRPSFYGILFAAALLATGFSAKKSSVYAGQASIISVPQTSAAYRDGLYVGRFHRKDGMTRNAPVGRWSTYADRRDFIEGYELGYAGSLK